MYLRESNTANSYLIYFYRKVTFNTCLIALLVTVQVYIYFIIRVTARDDNLSMDT